MPYSFLSLLTFIFLFSVSVSSLAVTPLYDELGRLVNGDEVYQEYNPPPKRGKGYVVPEIDRYNSMGMTPLQSAVRFAKVEEVHLLLGKKANPNVISSYGKTALQMAVSGNQIEIAGLLLAHKADPNLKETLGMSKSDEMTRLLKAHGAKPGMEQKKKDVYIRLMSSEEAEILNETIEQSKKNNRPIPTLAQAVILDVNPGQLDEMLKKGKDINEVDPVFGSALDQFFEQRRGKSVGIFLLEKGANPNLKTNRVHPLFNAVSYGDAEIISLMLTKGARVRIANDDGRSALSLAAEKGKVDIASVLIRAGANVDAPDEEGKTALYYVLQRNPQALDMIRLLLEHNASTIVAPKRSALAVLNWRAENVDAMLLLLQHKAKPVIRRDGTTLVMFAVGAGNISLLNAAIKAGVDVNLRDRDENSALQYAVLEGRADMVRVLLAAGAPVNASVNSPGRRFVDSYGKIHAGTDDLLAIAVRKGDISVIRALIDAGIHLDTTANSFEKPAPLHIAVKKRRSDIVDILLMAGANVECRDRYGRTPLHITARYPDEVIARRLLAAGANPNATNDEGETPLDVLSFDDKVNLEDILLKAGGQKGTRKEKGW